MIRLTLVITLFALTAASQGSALQGASIVEQLFAKLNPMDVLKSKLPKAPSMQSDGTRTPTCSVSLMENQKFKAMMKNIKKHQDYANYMCSLDFQNAVRVVWSDHNKLLEGMTYLSKQALHPSDTQLKKEQRMIDILEAFRAVWVTLHDWSPNDRFHEPSVIKACEGLAPSRKCAVVDALSHVLHGGLINGECVKKRTMKQSSKCLSPFGAPETCQSVSNMEPQSMEPCGWKWNTAALDSEKFCNLFSAAGKQKLSGEYGKALGLECTPVVSSRYEQPVSTIHENAEMEVYTVIPPKTHTSGKIVGQESNAVMNALSKAEKSVVKAPSSSSSLQPRSETTGPSTVKEKSIVTEDQSQSKQGQPKQGGKGETNEVRPLPQPKKIKSDEAKLSQFARTSQQGEEDAESGFTLMSQQQVGKSPEIQQVPTDNVAVKYVVDNVAVMSPPAPKTSASEVEVALGEKGNAFVFNKNDEPVIPRGRADSQDFTNGGKVIPELAQVKKIPMTFLQMSLNPEDSLAKPERPAVIKESVMESDEEQKEAPFVTISQEMSRTETQREAVPIVTTQTLLYANTFSADTSSANLQRDMAGIGPAINPALTSPVRTSKKQKTNKHPHTQKKLIETSNTKTQSFQNTGDFLDVEPQPAVTRSKWQCCECLKNMFKRN